MDKVPITFQAEIVSHSPMENTGFTLCRARVFYTGLNRNGSYINAEFAEQLANSAIGCPIVGLWDYEKHDFTDHSPSDRKRAYGFVPENPNFAWEKSYDYTGVEHEYASFDIVLWTKAFEEAKEIISHPLSMELNPDTINGSFTVVNGEYCFYFTSAEMLGFCVLGYDVEPCFEGARFITIDEAAEFKKLFQKDKQEAINSYNKKGEISMEEIEKEVAPVVEENPVTEFTEIRDDDIEIPEEVEKVPVEENQVFEKHDEPQEDDEKEPTPEEFAHTISMLNDLNQEFKNKIDELEEKVTKLEQMNFALNEYKENKLKEEKQNVVKSYEEVLTEEELNNIEIDKYSVEELNDKLAAMAYRKIASRESANFQLIYTDVDKQSNDIDDIIKKYKKD